MRKALRFILEEVVILGIVLYLHWEVEMSDDTKKLVRWWLIVVLAVGVVRLLQGG